MEPEPSNIITNTESEKISAKRGTNREKRKKDMDFGK
jgi:hypothetical protein